MEKHNVSELAGTENRKRGVVASLLSRVSLLSLMAVAAVAGVLFGGPAQAQNVYTQNAWTDGVQFPIDPAVIGTVMFAAGATVLVAVFSVGGGFRLVGVAFRGILRWIKP